MKPFVSLLFIIVVGACSGAQPVITELPPASAGHSVTAQTEWKESYCANSSDGKCSDYRIPFGVYNSSLKAVEWKNFSPKNGIAGLP